VSLKQHCILGKAPIFLCVFVAHDFQAWPLSRANPAHAMRQIERRHDDFTDVKRQDHDSPPAKPPYGGASVASGQTSCASGLGSPVNDSARISLADLWNSPKPNQPRLNTAVSFDLVDHDPSATSTGIGKRPGHETTERRGKIENYPMTFRYSTAGRRKLPGLIANRSGNKGTSFRSAGCGPSH